MNDETFIPESFANEQAKPSLAPEELEYLAISRRDMDLKEAELAFKKEVWSDIKVLGYSLLEQIVKLQK